MVKYSKNGSIVFLYEKKGLSLSAPEKILVGGEESRRSNIRRLAEITAPTALFLSVSARFVSRSASDQNPDETSDSLHNVFSWLWQRMLRAGPQGISPRHMAANISRSLSDSVRRSVVVDLLRAADVGLRDMLLLRPDDDQALAEFASRAGELSKIEQDRARRLTAREERIQFLHHGAIGDVMLEHSSPLPIYVR